jgi:hypothetical protein
MNQVPRRVTGDVSLFWIKATRTVFSKPIPHVIEVQNPSAMGLYLAPLGIQPDGAGFNELCLILGGLGTPCGRNDSECKDENCGEPSQLNHHFGMHSGHTLEIRAIGFGRVHIHLGCPFREP